MIPIECSTQPLGDHTAQQRRMSRWRVTTLKTLLVLAVAPRNRYHGENPSDEPESTIRAICGAYDSTTPTHTTPDSRNDAASCPRLQSDMAALWRFPMPATSPVQEKYARAKAARKARPPKHFSEQSGLEHILALSQKAVSKKEQHFERLVEQGLSLIHI